jgi:hypothetical protein
MPATPARLVTTVNPARERVRTSPACWLGPHRRTRPPTQMRRPRRRLKRGVRRAGLVLGALLLAGVVGGILQSARTGASVSPAARLGLASDQAGVDRAEFGTPSDHPSQLAGWLIPIGVRPAGYLIPDDGSEESAHAGG